MSNKINDYRAMASEALEAINSVENSSLVNHGTEKALVALTMVVGDLNEISKKSISQLNSLNEKIENYSNSSDKHATAMKWLTFGLFFIGIAQVLTAILLKN